MKGLLLKDIYIAGKNFRSFLMIIAGFLVLSVWSRENLFFVFYPMLLSSALPVSLLSYDEKFRWNVYCDALPCSRAQAVSEKYLICLGCIVLMALLSLITQLISISMGRSDLKELPVIMSALLAMGFICPGLMLPVLFKMGTEKGRLIYYGVVGFFCASGFIVASFDLTSLRLPVIVLPVASLLLFGLSWLLSIRFYKKRVL